MVDFIETPRFPEDISYGSSGGPEYKTGVVSITSGFEARNQDWKNARHRYDVTYGIRDANALRSLLSFFHECRGKLLGFRFKDWNDYTAYDQVITPILVPVPNVPVLDSPVIFCLVKKYGNTNPYIRRITKPVEGTVVLKKNGVVIPDTGYEIDYTTGVCTFQGLAGNIADSDVYTWSGEFDVPCRFEEDSLSINLDTYTLSSSSTSVVEIRL